jgi:uncharacterized lipoprotein NlpE involved in copper resistance
MMKKIILMATGVALLLLGLQACKQKQEKAVEETTTVELLDDGHNSRNSLDWDGVYTGTIPCADCEGIEVSITLNTDETYQVSYKYLGKPGEPEVSTGKFTWDDAGGKITLDSKSRPPYYIVGENQLIQLDMEGNPITGEHADMYILKKIME